jgi:hypothetical protein
VDTPAPLPVISLKDFSAYIRRQITFIFHSKWEGGTLDFDMETGDKEDTASGPASVRRGSSLASLASFLILDPFMLI